MHDIPSFLNRRAILAAPILAGAVSLTACFPGGALADQGTPRFTKEGSAVEFMPAIADKDYGKARTVYPDYEMTPSGLQYKDLRVGQGAQPKQGSTCVVDWDGFTIGYYGADRVTGPVSTLTARAAAPPRRLVAAADRTPAGGLWACRRVVGPRRRKRRQAHFVDDELRSSVA